MNRTVMLALTVLPLVGCSLFHRPYRPPRAPGAERGDYAFPQLGVAGIPSTRVTGDVATAIAMAMDDFFLSMPPLPTDADEVTRCLRQRDVWAVQVVPHSEHTLIVEIAPRHEACDPNNVTLDGEALYAIDTQTWRILSVRK
ncbi:hypothetical protein KRR26_13635 [Corallococcus sp. M34]|uniref:hypothetical protein n=1 Tax=Citreicoccus inhibens TaxID=2849499 RepID=UPI001C24158D|nr:hypothetical protein [Citreicoccus inhibens]MBU8896654.1 hypothetical protein [Citreicoccus inhibens]